MQTERDHLNAEASIEPPVKADYPIERSEDDLLNRAKLSRSFADQILHSDTRQGLVVGVLGTWGSGKSSFVHLARYHLNKLGAEVLEFNPWMFSGAEQLVTLFFAELSAQMKDRKDDLINVAEALADYGDFFADLGWLPLVGPWIERARVLTRIFGKFVKRRGELRKQGIHALRSRIENSLAGRSMPIVVVLDDIDRLTTSEIRDVFKLVRLTGSFPNMVYVLAFDRVRIERALDEHGVSGRIYLEKILRLTIDLRVVPKAVLEAQLLRSIREVVSTRQDHGLLDESLWPTVFSEVIVPFVANIRDLKRYILGVQGTLRSVGDQVAVVDILAMEAIRVFLPDIYHKMHDHIDVLTTTSDRGDSDRRERDKLSGQVDEFIGASGEYFDVVRALVLRLFPGAVNRVSESPYAKDMRPQWLNDRRIAHRSVFRFYLERVVNDGPDDFTSVENAWTRMQNREALDQYLRSLDADSIREVISSLSDYQDQFSSEHVLPSTIVLLNLLPDIPERPTYVFEFSDKARIIGIVRRLLGSLKKPDIVASIVREILPQVTTLSSKLVLIDIIGYREVVADRLVSESAALSLEKEWREEVCAAEEDVLVKERDLYRILLIARTERSANEPVVAISKSPCMTLAILKSAYTMRLVSSVTGGADREFARLGWDDLEKLYGIESIRERIDMLKSSEIDGSEEIVTFAEKYLGGWRPDPVDGEQHV